MFSKVNHMNLIFIPGLTLFQRVHTAGMSTLAFCKVTSSESVTISCAQSMQYHPFYLGTIPSQKGQGINC